MLDKEAQRLREETRKNIEKQIDLADTSKSELSTHGLNTERSEQLETFRVELARREAELVERRAQREAMQEYLDNKVTGELNYNNKVSPSKSVSTKSYDFDYSITPLSEEKYQHNLYRSATDEAEELIKRHHATRAAVVHENVISDRTEVESSEVSPYKTDQEHFNTDNTDSSVPQTPFENYHNIEDMKN